MDAAGTLAHHAAEVRGRSEAGLVIRAVAHAPGVTERPLGWLKYLHRKAGFDDDWSRSGAPHPQLGIYSTAPILSWPCFDLTEASYLLACSPTSHRRGGNSMSRSSTR